MKVEEMTPIEALNKLQELKKKIEGLRKRRKQE
jgi:hypothetical protein